MVDKEIVAALKAPLHSIGTLVSVSVLYVLSMLFYTDMVYAGPAATFFAMNNSALVQVVFLILSVLAFVFMLGCFSRIAERLGKNETRGFFWRLFSGIRLLGILVIVSVVYSLLLFVPGAGILLLLYDLLLVLFLPAMLIRAAVLDSFSAGFHLPTIARLVFNKKYLQRLGISVAIVIVYSLITTGISQGLLLLSEPGVLFYVLEGVSILAYVFLLAAAIVTVIGLLVPVVGKK